MAILNRLDGRVSSPAQTEPDAHLRRRAPGRAGAGEGGPKDGPTMVDYRRCFGQAIERLRDERRYRVFADLERDVARFPHALWRPEGADGPTRDVVIWCSNDYLAMGQHPDVIGAMTSAAQAFGAGAGGTRNISGTIIRS